MAITLNNLAILYSNTNRLQQAEPAFREALEIRRDLVRANPAAYRPNVATTLNNLMIPYRTTNRLQQAEPAFREALEIPRKLAQANPAAYSSDLADRLTTLAFLLKATARPEEAAQTLDEAIIVRRKTYEQNPAGQRMRLQFELKQRIEWILETHANLSDACPLAVELAKLAGQEAPDEWPSELKEACGSSSGDPLGGAGAPLGSPGSMG